MRGDKTMLDHSSMGAVWALVTKIGVQLTLKKGGDFCTPVWWKVVVAVDTEGFVLVEDIRPICYRKSSWHKVVSGVGTKAKEIFRNVVGRGSVPVFDYLIKVGIIRNELLIVQFF